MPAPEHIVIWVAVRRGDIGEGDELLALALSEDGAEIAVKRRHAQDHGGGEPSWDDIEVQGFRLELTDPDSNIVVRI